MRNYLPEASRFETIDDMDWAFGTLGIQDKARHLATLYLEDMGDLIKECIDPHFGFSRYAERLSSSASSFDPIQDALDEPDSLIRMMLKGLLVDLMEKEKPDAVCLSVPFPGNLYAALICGDFIKKEYPGVSVIMGGGYPNTELRSLSEERLFNFVDFVCLDDGEAPLAFLLEHLSGSRDRSQLKRTFALTNGVVCYHNNTTELDIAQRETGTPDYSDFQLDKYLSVIEVMNPMHRLWSDGRWNKLTLAHGCYWGKCTFCDVTLDYIKNYEPLTAAMLCDRMETIIAQTGETGFHFVDEAAPPALMRDLAIEILKRKLTVTWWTNIRFEKSFTLDLCRLLSASGCIAIAGGLEVASDRLLDLIKKGVTVAQVARVANSFTKAGIMVHAYLMYGFPTQTDQETIDALEMVRQLFEEGAVKSGFWHRFAMTAHSPVGLDPSAFQVERVGPHFDGFAENDLEHKDPFGAKHEKYAAGLRKSLFNYMHSVNFDFELSDWFSFKTPETTVEIDFISKALADKKDSQPRANARMLWLNKLPAIFELDEEGETLEFVFYNKKNTWAIDLDVEIGEWLAQQFPLMHISHEKGLLFSQFKKSYEEAGFEDFSQLESSYLWKQMREEGLLIL